MADCHIGAWKDPKLKQVNTRAFVKAVDICIEKNVSFIVIAGDLFNTSMPGIEELKTAVEKLKQLKEKDIPVYIIAGSHDYSPSGKTMLDVLESAGLCTNVAKGEKVDDKLKLKFTLDKKTGVKLTGMLGKRGALEKQYYENMLREHLEEGPGYKIFLFHSLLSELKPKELENVDSQPISLLPKHFSYYAGGHPHIVYHTKEKDYGTIAYPGPLFPNNFKELEQLERGGFYIVDDKVEFQPVQIYNTDHIKVDCNHKSPEEVREELHGSISNKEFINTIVTIRLYGILETGKPSDIGMKDIFEELYDKGAYFVMKNTSALSTKEFEEIKGSTGSVDEIENSVIKEHLGQMTLEGKDEKQIVEELMKVLSTEKDEGEKVAEFERRINHEMQHLFET
jgi:hypothetical protein